MAEKGFQFAEITSNVETLPGGPKLVKVIFDVQEGPKVRIREVDFVGNTAMGDGTLRRKMKETKQHGMLSWLTGGGTYKEAKFEEDADAVVAHYRNEGYIEAKVGTPELKTLEDAKRRQDALDPGADSGHRRGPLQGRRVRLQRQHGGEVGGAAAAVQAGSRGTGTARSRSATACARRRRSTAVAATSSSPATRTSSRSRPPAGPMDGPAEPTVNVTMQIQEGEQYFVNRITFIGNTTTRDTVVRREMRLIEGSVFNTEALKYSVRRLNQVGYFKTARGGPGRRRQEDPEREEQGRRHPQARGAEPQPADLRRRRVAVRGLLRPAVVPDRQLPRPRREPDPVAAGRLAGAELPGGVHRAVPVRPQHHRRHRRLPAAAALHQPVHPGVARRQPAVRVPGRRLLPDVPDLQLRAGRGARPQRGLPEPGAAGAEPVPARLAADRRRAARGRSARSSRASPSTPSTTRSSRPPGAS